MRSRRRRFNPMMFEEILHNLPNGPQDSLAIILCASLIRDDAPWLYELARAAYETSRSENPAIRDHTLKALLSAIEFTVHGPFMELIHMESEEDHMMFMDAVRVLQRVVERLLS